MRISINRIDLIALALALVTLLAVAFAPAKVFGQDTNTLVQLQDVPSAIEGIVTKRTADTFTVRSAGGTETVVVLTDTTTVKMVRKGLFRRDRISGARNHSLSERRANAVIDYLVTKHGLPPRRLVQPFGYGSSNPVASNDTSNGRALNRRVEISVLINKGISSEAAGQAASQDPRP